MRIAITGGIGNGKSFVCEKLMQRGYEVFNCDNAAKCLMVSSADIINPLKRLVGEDVYVGGCVNKPLLSSFILSSSDNAAKVNGIVHPVVASDFISSGLAWMECAILFTSGFDRLVDKAVCVTAPLEVRIRRVMERDNLDREKAKQWIDCQMPQEEMAARCDYLILNDGIADLDNQIDSLLAIFAHK